MHIMMIQVSGYEWHEDIGIKRKIILDHIYMCIYIICYASIVLLNVILFAIDYTEKASRVKDQRLARSDKTTAFPFIREQLKMRKVESIAHT